MSKTETLSKLTIEQAEQFFIVLRTEDSYKAFGVATNIKAAKRLLATIRKHPEAYGVGV